MEQLGIKLIPAVINFFQTFLSFCDQLKDNEHIDTDKTLEGYSYNDKYAEETLQTD